MHIFIFFVHSVAAPKGTATRRLFIIHSEGEGILLFIFSRMCIKNKVETWPRCKKEKRKVDKMNPGFSVLSHLDHNIISLSREGISTFSFLLLSSPHMFLFFAKKKILSFKKNVRVTDAKTTKVLGHIIQCNEAGYA